ncbi:DUF3891 family protein [Lentibacillus sp. N15]|uniref:DUF3891 family protein n=1 Tax=Lentibacillus songyuanensis TaxID=3136161 RepID=UPI0031BB9744
MIVREHDQAYIMIEQDNHAHISGELAAAWKDSLFIGHDRRKSVEYAVSNHDLGWKLLDQQPFWNDQKNTPYTFIDFPTLPKTVFYKHGIEEVALHDTYAGLLCSRHYTRFLKNNELPAAQAFVQQEEARQHHMIEAAVQFDQENYDFHYAVLQFCDNISLYICLNDPGVTKQEEQSFFKKGLPVPASFHFFNQEKAKLNWQDEHTIQMQLFPFDKPVNLNVKQKVISKAAVSKNGLLKSYQSAPFEKRTVQLVRM